MSKQAKDLSRYSLRKNGEHMMTKTVKVHISAAMVDALISRGIAKSAPKAEEMILDKVFNSPAYVSGMFGLGFDRDGDFGAGDDFEPMHNSEQPVISWS
jgi:hypothetical protein